MAAYARIHCDRRRLAERWTGIVTLLITSLFILHINRQQAVKMEGTIQEWYACKETGFTYLAADHQDLISMAIESDYIHQAGLTVARIRYPYIDCMLTRALCVLGYSRHGCSAEGTSRQVTTSKSLQAAKEVVLLQSTAVALEEHKNLISQYMTWDLSDEQCGSQWRADYTKLHGDILNGKQKGGIIVADGPGGLSDKMMGYVSSFIVALVLKKAWTTR